MSVSVNYNSSLTVNETLTTNVPAATAPTIVHDGFNRTKSLNGGSSQAVAQVADFVQNLTSGAASIDLTALPSTNGAVISGNGLKVQMAKFAALGTNVNPITIKFGVSNPYNLLGTSWQISLAPGEEVLMDLNNAAPTIDSTHKSIDLSGTAAQGVNVSLVLG